MAPVLLSIPFAFSRLGWAAGVTWLALSGVVTFYSYNLLSLVLEQQAQLGRRQLRFRDMARDILGEHPTLQSTKLNSDNIEHFPVEQRLLQKHVQDRLGGNTL